MQLLRDKGPSTLDETNIMLFESALSEIGANVLTHGRKDSPTDEAVDFRLTLEGHMALATFVDHGPPVHNHLTRAMPDRFTESGRGLAIACQVLDELGYEREGEINKWRLVKRL